MGVVVGSILQQGALAKRYECVNDPSVYWLSEQRRHQFQRLYQFSDECGVPLAELGVRFPLSNPDIDCVLMGARSAAEVEQNVAAIAKGPLSADILAELDKIAAMVPFRPFNEPFGMGWLMPDPYSFKGPGKA